MVHPAAHGLIGHQDPTLGQQILDVAEAQGEPDTKPDRLLDDLGREAVAAIADLGHHRWLRLKVTDGKPNGDVTMPPEEHPRFFMLSLMAVAISTGSSIRRYG